MMDCRVEPGNDAGILDQARICLPPRPG